MSALDITIIFTYFVAILGAGFWFGRKEKDTRDFFIGNRQIHWGAVLLSIVATEISAATFLAVPATGFRENLNYFQFGLGSLVARFFIAALFIGAYYRYDCVTVYEYLSKRFGDKTRYTATIFFFVTRLLGSGVRLLIAALGLAVVMGWPLSFTIVLFAVIAVVYTSFGGIKAIIWTDVIQAFVFIAGGAAVIWFLLNQVPGGFEQIWKIADNAGKLEVFKWAPEAVAGQSAWKSWLTQPNIFWIAFINAFVTTLAALGTDQDMTQRMITCKTASLSKRSLILSGFIGIPVMAIFLFVGIGIFAYYQTHSGLALPYLDGTSTIDYEKIFPHFIRTALPSGVKGLLVIGIFAAAMSSLDSALGALSSSSVVDIYRPLIHRDASEKHYLWISRINIVIFGVVLAGIAWMLSGQRQLLWLCFKVVSITYGALLGVFLLGATSTRGSNSSNLIAMISGAVVNTALLILIETNRIPLAWTWLILIGTLWTYGLSYGLDIVGLGNKARGKK